MFWLGQHAGFVFAEHLIPMTRYKIVKSVANSAWQCLSHARDFPDSAQRGQRLNDSIRARQQTLGSAAIIKDNIEGVEIERVSAVSF